MKSFVVFAVIVATPAASFAQTDSKAGARAILKSAFEDYHPAIEAPWYVHAEFEIEESSTIPAGLPGAGKVDRKWRVETDADRVSGIVITGTTRTSDRPDGVELVDVPRTAYAFRMGKNQSTETAQPYIEPYIPNASVNEMNLREDGKIVDPIEAIDVMGKQTNAGMICGHVDLMLGATSPFDATVTFEKGGSRAIVELQNEEHGATWRLEFDRQGDGWLYVAGRTTEVNSTASSIQTETIQWSDFTTKEGLTFLLPQSWEKTVVGPTIQSRDNLRVVLFEASVERPPAAYFQGLVEQKKASVIAQQPARLKRPANPVQAVP